MSIKITIAEIIFLLVIFHSVAAQNNDLKFNLVEGPDGKPPGKIRNMTQDPHGYMWFASEGDRCIYRYDGNKITALRHDDKNPNSLGGTGVNSVYADEAGMIWIGLRTGLDQFNPATGIFKHYRHAPNDPGSIDGEVFPVIKDRQNRLWAGTDKGLYRLDEKTGKFIHYKNEPGNPKSLSSNSVWTIYEDRQGIIWIGTGMPWFNIHPEDGGLNRMEPDGSFTRYMHDPKDPHSLINNKVAAIFEDSKGIFWVGTSKDGLHTLDRKTGLFERHLYNSKAPGQLSRPPLKPGEVNDKITFINEDSTGNIWIGTRSSGINRYDPVTKKITLFKHSHGFPDSTSWNAFISGDGELWITTENAMLYRADPFYKSMTSFPTSDPVRCFLEDKEKNLWVGTHDGGLYRYDQQKNSARVFRNNLSDTISLSNNINSLFQNQENEICVGTVKGLQIFNQGTQHFSRLNYGGSLKNSAGFGINKIFQDKQGLIWFAWQNAGLALYNPKDSSFKYFLSNADDSASIGSNLITSILQDKSGNFWFSAVNVGINRLIKGTQRFRHYLPGIDGSFMYEDSEGSIWCGTRKGLYRYNKKDDSFSPFFDSQSEISKEGIDAIIEDDGKNLWVTTPSVIIKLNPARNETVIYDSRFGIINRIQRGAIYKTANGQILVGHEKGFYTFFPNELAISFPTPKIVITDLSINNLPVLPGKGNLLQKPIGETDRIVLKYNLNNIAFNFSAIDYRAPETIKYFTKLENYDDTWRETGAEKSAYYFYVNPGTYVFRVRAINGDGTIGEKAITIRINPPWWKTWLFRIAAVICLVGLLYSLIRWRLQHKFRLQLERSEKERQMAELKQKGTELEMQALRAQMNPHFIFNSLNSINRFILQNNKAQASEYLTKFSKLVRMILQNSQASLITLENELESLELYLELEALRFNYHFDYKISVPKDMDISVLKVPPLILQPYVENAIWHGLMHKEEKGHLDIEVIEQNDHLYFKITDDGVGREKAAALASKSATKHKSMGLRITAHRIAMLHNSQTLTSPVTINDLVDADGSAAGTEVTIKMPVLYD